MCVEGARGGVGKYHPLYKLVKIEMMRREESEKTDQSEKEGLC